MEPSDLPALLQRSRAVRAEIGASPSLDAATKLLFEVQYAQHELAATLLHSGMDREQVMRIVYNLQSLRPEAGA